MIQHNLARETFESSIIQSFSCEFILHKSLHRHKLFRLHFLHPCCRYFARNLLCSYNTFYEEQDIMLYCNNVTLNVFFNVRGNKTLQQKVAIKL